MWLLGLLGLLYIYIERERDREVWAIRLIMYITVMEHGWKQIEDRRERQRQRQTETEREREREIETFFMEMILLPDHIIRPRHTHKRLYDKESTIRVIRVIRVIKIITHLQSLNWPHCYRSIKICLTSIATGTTDAV